MDQSISIWEAMVLPPPQPPPPQPPRPLVEPSLISAPLAFRVTLPSAAAPSKLKVEVVDSRSKAPRHSW
ncbi:hypothetical protein D3C72_2470100 [compost metagenome]